MADNADFQPAWSSPPGESIETRLKAQGISAHNFCEMLHASKAELERLMSGETGIDLPMAKRLNQILGGSIRFWLTREAQYREDIARADLRRDAELKTEWLRLIPVNDLTKHGWIKKKESKNDQIQECLDFFDVSSVTEWNTTYGTLARAAAFRTSPTFQSNDGAVAAWLRCGEIKAGGMQCNSWDPEKLRLRLNDLRQLSRRKFGSGVVMQMQEICSDCGVAFAMVEAPRGCRASGATRMLSESRAMLLLSYRHRTDDHFWFTFFHEAGHLLLHDQSALFVDSAELQTNDEEAEANRFSQDILIPVEFREELLALGKNFKTIIRFASKIGVSPGIVVGQLQHLGHLERNRLNYLKRSISIH